MSWFDPSNFSSFAKTALSQAQNLQKSIDKVLDIQETPSRTASNSSVSSQQKSTPVHVPVSGDSAEESLTTRKSSTSLSTNSASKSSRKTSLGVSNSKDSDSEGNSFWSSFLGDSLTNAESKPSSRKTSARKLGSRVSGNRIGGSDNRHESDSTNASNGQENISSVRLLKQQDKKLDISVIDAAKSDEHLVASSHALLLQQQSTADGSEELCLNQDKNNADSVKLNALKNIVPEKVDYNTQEVAVAPAESDTKAKSERLKLSPSGKSRGKGKKKPLSPETDVSKSHGNPSLQDVSAVRNSELPKEKRSNAGYKEPQSLLELEAQSPNTDPVHSTQNDKSEESYKTAENTLDVTSAGNLGTQVVVDGSAIAITKSVNSDHDDLSVVDPMDNAVVTDAAGHEIQQEPSEQNKVFDVKPLASSTPNHRIKKESALLDQTAKTDLIPSRPTDHNISQTEDSLADVVYQSESPVSNITDNKTISENVAEMFMEAASIADNKKSVHNIPKQEVKEIASADSGDADKEPIQQPSTNSGTATIIPEETTEEKESNLMENHANSTENSEDSKRQIAELKNEVASLKHVIEVRESKLVEVSKENVDLEETSAILRSQLKQAEAALKAEDEEIEEVRQEFTVRVTATEKKYQAAAKERDRLKMLLQETEQSLGSKNDKQSEEFTTLLKEKDDQIAQLLEEGEKLSKQQLQSNNIVKKLRSKEKENDALIKKNSKLLEDATSENERLTEILQVRDETERKQADAIKQLNAYVEKQETQISKLKSELDDSAEKIRSMQAALDNAYKQLADLHKENASKDSAVQEAALSAEMTAKEGLRIAMEKKERQFKNEIEALEFQISDLQTGLRRGEQQANRREDNLRQEISDLQQRLQEAEARNQELTESVSFATRPLLRQIENLQSSYGNHTQTWERVERNLTERLNEAQIQLVEAQEKERVAAEHALELNSRLTSVESQLATYRQDKSRLEATLDVERARLEAAEEARSREAARSETLEIKYRKMMEDNNVEKALLEQQLAVERGKMETEKKKFQHALDEKERTLVRQSSISGAPPSPSAREEFSQVEVPEASSHRTLGRQSSGTSVIDGISRGIMGAGTAMIERLQAQVKQKDGEIVLLQGEITSLQKTRDAVTEELTVLTSKLESLEQDSQLLADLQTRHKELEQRHNAVLQMYGEKAEQAEELRMDLEDVKSMYKSQIQELLGASR